MAIILNHKVEVLVHLLNVSIFERMLSDRSRRTGQMKTKIEYQVDVHYELIFSHAKLTATGKKGKDASLHRSSQTSLAGSIIL